jgi:hypothetical protein
MKKKALHLKVVVYTERQKKERQNEKEIKDEMGQRKRERKAYPYIIRNMKQCYKCRNEHSKSVRYTR